MSQVLLALHLDRVFELARGRAATPVEDLQARLAANRAARERAIADLVGRGVTPPFLALLEQFELAPFELDVLMLAVGMRVDPRILALHRALAPGEGALTVGTALRLLSSSVEAHLELGQLLRPHRALFARGLLRRPATDGLDATLIATRRTLAAVQGEPPLTYLPAWATRLGPLPARTYETDPVTAARALVGTGGGFALITGASGAGKTELARAIARAARPLVIEADLASAANALAPTELAAEVAELIEDASLVDAALVLDDAGIAFGPGHPAASALTSTRSRTGAIVVATVADQAPADRRLTDLAGLRIVLRGLRSDAALVAWRGAARGAPPVGLSLIGEDLVLTPRRIGQAAALVERIEVTPMAAIASLEGDASALLDPSRVQAGLDDIVLDDDARIELTEIISAIRSRKHVLEDWGMARRLSRGRGLSALFDGDPGTGKTMAAEVVASEVGLPLRRVNVATLVDKYIGETEKNLARVFAQARAGTNVLLFDEADSLFGGRTEVKGANDRYANLETNVLLQLMEDHTGIVILTTNLKRSIDQAFMRRISYKVQFKPPEAPQRRRLWDGLLPANDRAPDIDLAALAESFPMAGGDIKSAVMRAAYRAAGAARKISMADLVECAQLECQAMGRVISWKL